MTTRQTSAPATVPTVTQIGSTVGCLQNDGIGHLIFRADSPRHAEHMAAILRGLLADAFLAGKAEATS